MNWNILSYTFQICLIQKKKNIVEVLIEKILFFFS